MSQSNSDEEYLKLLTNPLKNCLNYKPKFGRGRGLTKLEFETLYGADPFYSWLGLDSPLMYTAHKAAGGITSIYRQIGVGCERLIQRLIRDNLGLTASQSTWSYEVQTTDGKTRTLSLDCRIPLADLSSEKLSPVDLWLQQACALTGVSVEVSRILKGAVFEVRQGYKSKDSKRQNADIANAAAAYSQAYLPVLLLLSTQMDTNVADRYKNARWLILYGTTTGSTTDSTYEFCRQVLNYDLADFFHRNSSILKQEVELVLQALLT
ncbi:MAG: hypothetical protein SXA11_25480 [Cyanobacteriota bacterium]|nr:hypothetical protein [Cyanobacteriota bacterium]